MDVADKLTQLAIARGLDIDPRAIDVLTWHADKATVDMIWSILSGTPLADVAKNHMMESLGDKQREVVDLAKRNGGFISSMEVAQTFDLNQSAAVNRIKGIEARGALVEAFSWHRSGGGKRMYYALGDKPWTKVDVDKFVATLKEGGAIGRMAGKDIDTAKLTQ